MRNIIDKLRYNDGSFPNETLLFAIDRKEEITPLLLDEIDKVIAKPTLLEDETYIIHIYSMYLLAHFRENEAFEKIVDFIRIQRKLDYTITEGLPSILYSTFDGRVELLQEVINNPALNIYARVACLDVYGKLYLDKVVSKESCVNYLRYLIYELAFDGDSDIATYIQNVVVDRHIFELVDDIQYLYDDDRIDVDLFGEFHSFIDSIFNYKNENESINYMENGIQEMEWWDCFRQPTQERRKSLIDELKKITDELEKENKEVNCEGTSYPKVDGERQGNEVLLSDIYDKEAIEIDRLVYTALNKVPTGGNVKKRDQENKERIEVLIKAYHLFLEKCEREGFKAFSEYDKKHKIHYKSMDWVDGIMDVIYESGLRHEFDYFVVEYIETATKIKRGIH